MKKIIVILVVMVMAVMNVMGQNQTDEEKFANNLKNAENGQAWAQYSTGWAYRNGRGVEKNDYKAFEWFQKAAAQNHKEALFYVAKYYYEGEVTTQDYNKSFEYFKKAAEQECTYAYDWMGTCYRYGYGVQQNDDLAIHWFSKSGSDFGKKAIDAIKNTPKTDEEKFAEWLEFANNGKAWAQNNVGWAYENGFGVAKNMAKAIEWYQKAANNGEANAQRNLGICYEHGHGVAVDKQKALYWYKVAMDNGNDKATDGYNNLVGQAGTPEEKFAVWLKQAEAGNIGAQCNVGWAYQNGFGVAKNESKAIEWYQKSANQGESVAQCNLGICYEAGLGVPQNIAKAKEWYQKSANQGNQTAQSCLNRLNQPQTAQVQQQQNRGGGFWNGLLGLMETTSQVLTAYDQYKNPQAYYNTSGDYGDNSYAGASSGTSSGSSYDEGIAREKNRQSDLEAKAKAREIERDKNNVTFWRDQLLQKYRRCVSELESMKRHKERNRSKRERLQDEMREIRQEARSRGVKPPIQKNSIEDWDGDVND